jgi:hypothetical protein
VAGFRKLTADIFILFILGVGMFGWLGQTAEAAEAEAEAEAERERETKTAAAGLIAVKVLVKDYAGVSPGDIEKATHVASRIYRRIGVEITWFGVGTGDQKIPGDPAGNEAFCASVLVVNLHSDPQDDGDRLGTMGMAAVGSRIARVFMDPVVQTAYKAQLPPSTVLGYVIAHELGHLLLPPNSHSRGGLMRATLDAMGVRMERLWFDASQAALIRVKLSGSIAPDLIARAREPDGW